jgi:hypothetical protein
VPGGTGRCTEQRRCMGKQGSWRKTQAHRDSAAPGCTGGILSRHLGNLSAPATAASKPSRGQQATGTPHSVHAGTMHVAAITSAADELPSPRRGAPDRTERTQPFIVRLRVVQMQRAHRQPCGRCVSQHAAQLVRPAMHTQQPRPRTAKATQHSPQHSVSAATAQRTAK